MKTSKATFGTTPTETHKHNFEIKHYSHPYLATFEAYIICPECGEVRDLSGDKQPEIKEGKGEK